MMFLTLLLTRCTCFTERVGRISKRFYQKGFDEHISRRGLYGNGCYFAAEMCKALQYTDTNHDERCVLYCRVVLGRPYYTRDALNGLRSPRELKSWYHKGWLSEKPEGEYNSVVATPGHKRGRKFVEQVHWEAVVFNGAQVYPEYILHVRI